MKRLLICIISIVAQTQCAEIFDAVFFDRETTSENYSPTYTRDCKSCSKPKCSGCKRR